ncbi:MAG: phosphodiesterase [Gammaproteobacteria bacterium (ex Lamellibrachia satsuma)]|nr:MAG: HD-GYP domain-containing protein [Gammaproteobacteria bacterium (ex Lamellibrachia satsuma)]RRS31285.1 MAG: phosphodiesterase [Gammaproteobacteria bacterium (ex Lamellibrachia satsuma)]RRS36972.1 MAG: phosphodiesterase [Gammaproteobacteria bacterium (ex Lamellibrachia satsuma)]
MIKKIDISSLMIGMYVHDLRCNWMKHPFAVNKFEIRNKMQIGAIRNAGIRELYIDTDKGIDTEKHDAAYEVKKQSAEKVLLDSETKLKSTRTKSLADELVYASKVKKEATRVVADIMEDARLGRQIELERVNPVVEGIVSSVMRNEDALLGLTRIRKMGKYTFEHSVSVSVLLTAFAKHLNFPEEDLLQIGIGGLLHDIGKIKTPQNILNKPGKLTDQEFAIMKKHVVYSKEILETVPGISDIILNIATENHERLDGTGYLDGKRGDEISIYGQMAAIVDVYDALTADRVYREGMPPNTALVKLVTWGSSHFNQELLQNFIHCVGIYPIGSVVSLSDARLAVVVESGKKDLLSPKIRIIFDSIKRQFLTPQDVDLSVRQKGEKITIVSAVDPAKWRISPDDYLDHRTF